MGGSSALALALPHARPERRAPSKAATPASSPAWRVRPAMAATMVRVSAIRMTAPRRLVGRSSSTTVVLRGSDVCEVKIVGDFLQPTMLEQLACVVELASKSLAVCFDLVEFTLEAVDVARGDMIGATARFASFFEMPVSLGGLILEELPAAVTPPVDRCASPLSTVEHEEDNERHHQRAPVARDGDAFDLGQIEHGSPTHVPKKNERHASHGGP